MNIKMKKGIILIIGLLAVGLLVMGVLNSGLLSDNNDGLTGEDPGTVLPPSPEEPVTEPDPQREPAEEPDPQEPVEEPDPQEPVEEPDPQEEPAEEPDPAEEPNTNPNPGSAEKPSKHMIYIGEQLTIPVSGGSAAKESIVINSAVLPSAEKQIALTFDAGWLYDQTINLLDVLDDYQAKSTFFLRGRWAEDHPELAKEILKRGHSTENHSLTHGHMKEMTEAEIRNEMAVSTKLIQEATGYRPYLFRPPFGEYDSRVLKILAEQGYPYTVMWTIDSLDWLEERNGVKVTAQYLTDRILSNATDKGIVLMHVGGYQTVNAMPGIIEGLQKDGYKLVKVNDMLPKLSTSGDVTIYTVKKGDTLSSIARQYGITVDDILKANPVR